MNAVNTVQLRNYVEDKQAFRTKVSAEVGRAKAVDGVDAIVLGCAGMADLAANLEAEHGLKVIDGVGAAAAFAAALINLRRGS